MTLVTHILMTYGILITVVGISSINDNLRSIKKQLITLNENTQKIIK